MNSETFFFEALSFQGIYHKIIKMTNYINMG